MKYSIKQLSWISKTFWVVVGIATIIGAIYAVRTYNLTSQPQAETSSKAESNQPITETKNNEIRDSEIKTHNQTSNQEINANNSNVNTGDVAGDLNQSVTIDEFPDPKLNFVPVSANVQNGNVFVSKIMLEIESKTVLKNLYLEARASSIVSIEAQMQRSGMQMSGHTGSRDGFAFTNVLNAYGKYLIVITSNKPDKFDLIYNYE